MIKTIRGWEIPERKITPEDLVMNRRGMLKTAGVLALAGAATACGPSSTSQNTPPAGT